MNGIPGQNAVNFPTVDDVDRGFGQASRRTDFFASGAFSAVQSSLAILRSGLARAAVTAWRP